MSPRSACVLVNGRTVHGIAPRERKVATLARASGIDGTPVVHKEYARAITVFSEAERPPIPSQCCVLLDEDDQVQAKMRCQSLDVLLAEDYVARPAAAFAALGTVES